MKPNSTKPKQILVVDDEPTLRLGFALTLRSESHLVETATDGREALQKLSEDSFDLIVLDLRMPELDGIETLNKLRQTPNHQHLPVILCSAHINFTNMVKALNLSCFHFLSKPVLPSELREAVAKILAPEIATGLDSAKTALSQGEWSKAISEIERIKASKDSQAELLRIAKALAEGRQLSPETVSPDILNLLVA